MKYIDAEKLIAKIERYKQGAAIARFDNAGENADYFQGKVDLCDDLTHIITSLQQEQPKLPGYDKALLEVKSKVDEIYEETSIGLSEYDSGLYNGIAETCMKLRGFIKARLDSDEQPEVVLMDSASFVKELKRFLSDTGNEKKRGGVILPIIKHFYELGLNARKEE